MQRKKSVVVVGGGTGAYTLLSGLKHYQEEINITAIITMADSGGSTGRLRDEFGQLPVGDVRMALAALSNDHAVHGGLLRELFLYRFAKGEGLNGHNFGNLFLTALTDLLGSEAAAVQAAARILNIAGTVVPVTYDNVHLVARYDDGVIVEGEHAIDDPAPDRAGKRIVELTTKPVGTLSEDARTALAAADLIVIGPGDLYSSLLSNLVMGGFAEAVAASNAPVVYIANLMERFGQTEGMTVCDCTRAIEAVLNKRLDLVVVNGALLPLEAVTHYAQTEGTQPVIDDTDACAPRVLRADILSSETVAPQAGDTVRRSLIRHDAKKLADEIMKVL